jgi:hypothetical protein
MKLRLEIEVEFEHEEDPSVPIEEFRQALDGNLLYIASNAAGNGLFTRNLHEVITEGWKARVVRLD